MTAKTRFVLVMCVTVLSVGRLTLTGQALATPVIKDFFSKGGHTQNKTGPADRMYLVKGGDKITFTIKAEGAEKYEWQVNKDVQAKATGNSLNWTVPDKKGIWEIRVKVIGKGGDQSIQDGQALVDVSKNNIAVREWVVTTLSKKEAPTIFDSFSDGRWQTRTEPDPWGRPLPEWKYKKATSRLITGEGFRCDCCSLKCRDRGTLSVASKVRYGTWKVRFRYLADKTWWENQKQAREKTNWSRWSYGKGPRAVMFFMYGDIGKVMGAGRSRASSIGVSYPTMADRSHNWPRFGFVDRDTDNRVGMEAASSPTSGGWGIPGYAGENARWVEVMMIRTPDGYVRLWKGKGTVPEDGHNGYWLNSIMNTSPLKGAYDTMAKCDRMSLSSSLRVPLWWTEFDNVEVYANRYLFPRNIRYGRYVDTYHWHWRTKTKPNRIEPVYRKGIRIDAHGVRLADIAKAVNDEKIFHYDPRTKTAVCYTDIDVEGGGKLVLDGETLKMSCSHDGEHRIRMKNGSWIVLKNATITSANEHYYLWVFNNEWCPGREYRYLWEANWAGRFMAEDSLIDNCGGMYPVGSDTFILKNTRLTRLREVKISPGGKYSAGGRGWRKISGQAHALTIWGRRPCSAFEITGCTISAADGKKVKLKFLGMDWFISGTTIRDTVLKNVEIESARTLKYYWPVKVEKFHIGRNKNKQSPNYRYSFNWSESTVNLVNVKFGKLSPGSEQASIIPKYYLDLKVQDAGGKPVENARVEVTNEVAPDFPPTNLAWGKLFRPENGVNEDGIGGLSAQDSIIPWYGQVISSAAVPRISDAEPVVVVAGFSSITTTKSGHTPLPSDRKHTIVLSDFVLTKSGKKDFTYRITIEAGGKKKVITGVNPGPHWYRPDPNKPTYTITAVLDGRTVTEAELKKKGQK